MVKPITCLALILPLIGSRPPGPPSGDRRFTVGDRPGMVALADLNGDGRLDLVVVDEGSADVWILLGDGKGGFSPSPGSPFPAGPDPNDVAIADFNRDGRLDLAFANHEVQRLSLLFGDGKGGFRPAPPAVVAVKPHPHGVAAGDFNGDGVPDLATDSWGEDRLQILWNDGRGAFHGPGSFVPVGQHPYQRIRAADLNGDGRPDLVSPNLDGGNVTILLGDGRGGFTRPPGSPFPCGDAPFNVAVGDLNGDGHPDLAIVDSPSSAAAPKGRDGMAILLGDGRGGFRAAAGSPFATDSAPNVVAIGDLDGNGLGEVVVSHPDRDHLTVFRITRQGTLASRQELPLRGHPKGLALGDLDGDGRAEIVVTLNAERSVVVVSGRLAP